VESIATIVNVKCDALFNLFIDFKKSQTIPQPNPHHTTPHHSPPTGEESSTVRWDGGMGGEGETSWKSTPKRIEVKANWAISTCYL